MPGRTTGPAGMYDRQFGVDSQRQLPPLTVVELTSGYDAATGYSWSELRYDIDAGQWAAPALPLTGDRAFDISGDTTLTAGTRCAMAIDRNQTAYALWFVVSTAGGGGSGSGSGSGSGDGCNAAVPTVSFACSNGRLVATAYTVGVGRDGNQLVLTQCSGGDTDLGPCSPSNPDGSTLPVATKVCPVFTALDYLDHGGAPRTVNVVTGLRVERRLVTVPVAGPTGCIDDQADSA